MKLKADPDSQATRAKVRRGQSEAIMRFPAAVSNASNAFDVPTDAPNGAKAPLPGTIETISSMPLIPLSSTPETVLAQSAEAAPASPSLRSTRRARKKQAKAAKARLAANMDCSEYRECLQQAEICREQARAAAGLKRFKAARGLFATAIGLCQRALGMKTGTASISPATTRNGDSDAAECDEAQEYLRQLTVEMSTYSELAKSMERPLGSKSTSSVHDAALSSLAAMPSSTMPVASASTSFSNSGAAPLARRKSVQR